MKLNSYTLKFNIFKQILQIISEVGPGNMINFASLFGGFQRGANSMVNDVLDNPNANLEQLLDIESFSNEYKSGSNKINEYMKYQRFLQLIKYVTVVGPQNDQKKGYKFPMVASDILSSDNSIALQFFLPDGEISVQKQYEQTEQIDIQVNDDDEQYLTESPEKEPNYQEQTTSQVESPSQNQQSGAQRTQQKLQTEQKVQQQASPKKTKIIKQLNIVKKKKKQPVQPLFSQLMSYFKGPINYTLAGYVSKILMVFFNKKPNNFYQKLFDTSKNYIAELSNHIQSRSVGDLVLRLLTYESAIFLQKRIQFYDHLVQLLSNKQQIHVITNLAFSLHDVIQKTSTYVKTKINIQNNPTVVETYMKIFYRDGLVHKIVNNTMNEDQNISGYNSFVLHGYLHNTEIQTFHSFKLQEVLQSFIKKAVQKLRNISNRKVLGVGRIKIIQIFTFLVKKQLKSLDDLQKSSKGTELSSETLQALFVHSLIAKNQDFFSILFQLTKLYEFNNILHNEVYKIVQTILKQPAAQQSALQLLILNDQDVLLKFICKQADYDSNIKRGDKKSRRKGYIGHVIKICQLINSLDYPLLNQKIKQRAQFKNVMKTLVANDEVQTSKSLAGYQMKRNPAHEIMFQKQEILKAYESFLCHSPKAEFQQPEEQHSEEQTSQQHVDISQQHHSQIDEAHKRALQKTQAELIAEQMDEQKFNQCIANAQPVDQVNPKFWMNNLQYDVDELLKEL